MSKCSVKCNEIKDKIDNISGLSDDYVFALLCIIEYIISYIDLHFEEI